MSYIYTTNWLCLMFNLCRWCSWTLTITMQWRQSTTFTSSACSKKYLAANCAITVRWRTSLWTISGRRNTRCDQNASVLTAFIAKMFVCLLYVATGKCICQMFSWNIILVFIIWVAEWTEISHNNLKNKKLSFAFSNNLPSLEITALQAFGLHRSHLGTFQPTPY